MPSCIDSPSDSSIVTAPLLTEAMAIHAEERGGQPAFTFLRDGEEPDGTLNWGEFHRESLRIAGQIGVIRGEPSVAADADMGTQWGRAMANLVTVLRAAGGRPEHLIMLRAYVTDIGEFNRAGAAVGKAWGETLGKHFPAMTLVQVSGLIDPAAKVEIEGEALLP